MSMQFSTGSPEAVATLADVEPASDSEPGGVTRRQALKLGAAVAAALVAGSCTSDREPSDDPTREELLEGLTIADVDEGLLGAPAAVGVGFEALPATLLATEARDPLPSELRVAMKEVSITFLQDDGSFATRTVAVRAYNGDFPGRTGYYDAGDRIEFTLSNHLPPSQNLSSTGKPGGGQVPRDPWGTWTDEERMQMNVPHGFNVTNVHTHGLHVSPGTTADGVSSDDVLVKVAPEGYPGAGPDQAPVRRYGIQLPDFHAPGTHWYHAHVHGSAALQVANGLAGALIVNEPDDELLRIDGDPIPDAVFLIQEIVGSGLDYRFYGTMRIDGDKDEPLFGGKPEKEQDQVKFTVNGQGNLRYELPGNQFHRLRLINATGSPRGFMGIDIVEVVDDQPTETQHGFYVIAIDGITRYGKTLASLETTKLDMLAPGARADILVQLTPGKAYALRKLATEIRSKPEPKTGPTKTESLMRLLALDGPGTPQQPPARLPDLPEAYCYLRPITEPATVQRAVQFAITGEPPQPAHFGSFAIAIDPPSSEPRPYGNPSGVPPEVEVQLGTVEEWAITNSSGAAHPFHIHVNPFQVVEEGKDPSDWIWRDTVALPPGETVTIRQRFLDYGGTFVIHCHVLVHEDAGMMWNIAVMPEGVGPGERLERCTCTTCT